MSRLRISETFTSVQGEGQWLGVPSHFIRLSGCNLRCVWCDTPYASWNPEGPMREIAELADEAAASGVNHVVITGGEPLLFDGVTELTARIESQGQTITIETAGTVYQSVACHLISLSPKLSHSAPPADTPGGWRERHEAARQNIEVMSRLITEFPHQLKFVVDPTGSGDDLKEIDELLALLPLVSPEKIHLMAEGRDAETLHRRERMLVPECLKRGWRLTPRYQIDLFGDTKGT